MFGAKTPFGSGGFGSSTSAFGTQQSTPFGGTSGGKFFYFILTFVSIALFFYLGHDIIYKPLFHLTITSMTRSFHISKF